MVEIIVHSSFYVYTVEPIYNGPVLSGHPLLSGQFSKSRSVTHTNTVFVTCIRQPTLLSGRRVAALCLSFLCYFYLYYAVILERKLSHMSFYAVFSCLKCDPSSL